MAQSLWLYLPLLGVCLWLCPIGGHAALGLCRAELGFPSVPWPGAHYSAWLSFNSASAPGARG